MIDQALVFSAAQTITASAISQNNIPIAPSRDLFSGSPVRARIHWNGTLATATSVDVRLEATTKPLLWPNGTAVTVQNSGDTVTLAAHGLAVGTEVFFASYGGGGLVNATVYYVTNPTTNTFQLSSTTALALAGTADIAPDADDASVTMEQYRLTLASTGAVSIARWNALKHATLEVPTIARALEPSTPLLGGAAGADDANYLSLQIVVAGSNLSGATLSAELDLIATDPFKYYPSRSVV